MERTIKIVVFLLFLLLVSCVNKNYNTIEEATKNLDSDSMFYFVRNKNINPNFTDKNNQSLLFKATLMNDYRLVKLLIKKDALVDLADSDNTTPLMIASLYGHEDIAKVLLENGANPNIFRKSDKFTALMFANQYGQTKISKLLIEAGAIETRKVSYSKNARMLLNAEMGNFNELRRLIELDKADINAYYTNTKRTALMLALKNNHKEIVDYLLEHNANINATDKNQKTIKDYDIFSLLEHE